MRYVSLDKIETGMCLAYDLYDMSGRVLAGANTIISQNYIERLRYFGFDGVYIQDKLSEDINVELVISPQLRVEGISTIRQQNIDGCKEIAKKMVEQILEKDSISLDLVDMNNYDDFTYAHSVNVAVICCCIGIGYQLTEEDITSLVIAALLHDFGKMMIPQEILNKPGRLSHEEFEIIKSHPKLSYDLISDRRDLPAQVKNAVMLHHENVDGSGYPRGMTGEQLTIFAKILHVADVYDALVSQRPYKTPYSPKEAAEYMMGSCGTLFDQNVVEMLLKYVPLYAKGTDVIFSDGRKGLIYENAGIHNLRPIVKLYNGELIDLSQKENFNITVESTLYINHVASERDENERTKMVYGDTKKKVQEVVSETEVSL